MTEGFQTLFLDRLERMVIGLQDSDAPEKTSVQSVAAAASKE